MRPKVVRISLALICLTAVLGVARLYVKAADTLPGQYTDAEFWRLVTDFSDAGGDYQYENFVSNEISYQEVIPELSRLAKPGGVYFGVASEQNFTYIDVVRPKVAFIFDVRRQNTLMMYKALFEMADNRADFVSLLFSRKRPGDSFLRAMGGAWRRRLLIWSITSFPMYPSANGFSHCRFHCAMYFLPIRI